MTVAHRAIREDMRRLDECLSDADEGLTPARAGAIRRYAGALLVRIRGHHEGEEEILWPVIAGTAGQSVDLAPLTDDHRAIEAAAAQASQALTALSAGAGTFGELRVPVGMLREVLDEHITDEEAQIVPAMRRYLTAEACLWCDRQIWRKAPVRERMFTVPWLARYAKPEELRRLLAPSGWPTWLLLAASRPGYARLERQAFGLGNPERDNRDDTAVP